MTLCIDKIYLFTFPCHAAKKIPYIGFIPRVFISENMISLCSNKPTGNRFYRNRGRDGKVSKRWSQENNRGFVHGRKASAAYALNDRFSTTVKLQKSGALCNYMVGTHWTTAVFSLWISLSLSSQTVWFVLFRTAKEGKKKEQNLWICLRCICIYPILPDFKDKYVSQGINPF